MIFTIPKSRAAKAVASCPDWRQPCVPGRLPCGARPDRRAYTLIEMLMVVGIIALVFTVFTFTRSSAPGSSLKAAQGELAGLVDLARLQARLKLGNGRTVDTDASRVIIYASNQTDSDLNLYLRQIQVIVPDPNAPDAQWVTTGDALLLPIGVYVLPPTSSPPVVNGLIWPTDATRVSQFVSMGNSATASATLPTSITVNGVVGNYFFSRFSSLMALNGNGDVISLSVANARAPGDNTDAEPIRFSDPQNIRGLRISQYGNVSLLNDAQDYP